MIDPLDPADASTLKAARKARKMTLTALAEKAGVAPSTILRVENGQDPQLASTWQPIVRALVETPLKAA